MSINDSLFYLVNTCPCRILEHLREAFQDTRSEVRGSRVGNWGRNTPLQGMGKDPKVRLSGLLL